MEGYRKVIKSLNWDTKVLSIRKTPIHVWDSLVKQKKKKKRETVKTKC